MSTNARIGIELGGGQIVSAYHHWDGYPEWLGKTLKEHYNTRADVAELIDGGDMSVCWTDDTWRDSDGKMGKKDSFGPQYYSERGEDCPPKCSENLTEYLQDMEEYAYIFNRMGEWICYRHDFDSETAVLTEIN